MRNNAINRTEADSIEGGKFNWSHSFRMRLSDFHDIAFFKSAIPNTPTFSPHVQSIVCISAKKEMIWADTGGVIAFVANQHSVWNRAKVQDPRCPVRSDIPTHIFSSEAAITMRQFGSNPNPTTRSLLDILPKSFGKACVKGCASAREIAIIAAKLAHSRLPGGCKHATTS